MLRSVSPPPPPRQQRTGRRGIGKQFLLERPLLVRVRAHEGLHGRSIQPREHEDLLRLYLALTVLQAGNDGLVAAELGRHLLLRELRILAGTPQPGPEDPPTYPRC